MPLPKVIKNSVEIKAQVNGFTDEIRDLFLDWYKLDYNAVPTPAYRLRALTDIKDNNYWKVVLPKLREALEDLVFEGNLKVGRSVTEYEVGNSQKKTSHPIPSHLVSCIVRYSHNP